MSIVSTYLLRILAAALIISMLTGMVDKKGSSGTLIRLVGGLFLTLTIIRPLVGFDWSYLAAISEDFSVEGEAATVQGKILAQQEYRDIIKRELETYILDKASEYQADLEVEVTLSRDDPPVPSTIRLQGAVSPYAKKMMQQMMEEELGVGKEDQQWIG